MQLTFLVIINFPISYSCEVVQVRTYNSCKFYDIWQVSVDRLVQLIGVMDKHMLDSANLHLTSAAVSCVVHVVYNEIFGD